MKKVYSVFLSLLLGLTANAQWEQIKDPLLSTVEYDRLVYTGTAILTATEGALFRSVDNGNTWTISHNGLDQSNIGARGLTYISSRGEVWISSNNSLFKSTDHGGSWTKVTPSGLPAQIYVDQVTRINNRLIMMYGYYDQIEDTHKVKLAYSDDGVNWTATVVLDSDSWWEFIGEANDKTLYLIQVPNGQNYGILHYTTNGVTTQLHPIEGLSATPGIKQRNFSIDPAGDNLFFYDEKTGIYYWYNPTDQEWVEKMNGIAALAPLMSFRPHSLSSRLFCTIICLDASLTQMEVKLMTSVNNGDLWTEIAAPGISFPIMESPMVVAGSGRIIANHFQATMCHSDDDGQTWSRDYEIFSGDFDKMAALSNGNLFVYTMDNMRPLYKSTDNGETWSAQASDLPTFQGLAFVNGLIPAGNWLYAIAEEEPDAGEFLFISKNEGVNWEKLTDASNAKNIEFAGMNGLWPVYKFTDEDENSSYQFTKDGGINWINIQSGIDLLSLDKVMGLRGNGSLGKLFLFGEISGKIMIYLSENDGTSFTDITSNLGAMSYDILVANRYDWDDHPMAVSGFRADGEVFIVAAYDFAASPQQVRFFSLNDTKDGWNQIGTDGLDLPQNLNWNRLLFNGGVWYFSTPVGIYASIDGCATWRLVWNNEGFISGINPKTVMATGYGLFLGTRGAGLWRTPLSAPVFTTDAASSVTDISAISGATITSTGGLPFAGKGICWATTTAPTVSDNVLYIDNTWNNFSGTMTPLTPNTDYFVRSFIISPKGFGQPIYGNEITFTSDQATTIETEKDGTILLFPNPSDGKFNLLVERDWSMEVMDISGRSVMSRRLHAGLNETSLANPVPGIYYLRLTGGAGETKIVRLIVK